MTAMDKFLGGLGSGFGGAAGASIVSGLGPGGDGPSMGRIANALEQEYNAYRRQENWDWRKAEDRGLTPQEYYGSAAAGGSAPSGATQTLGNAATQIDVQKRQAASNAFSQAYAADISLKQTEMQTDAQKYSADKAAEATLGAAGMSRETGSEANILNRERYENIDLPAARAKLKLTQAETKVRINEATTTMPKFVLALKRLSMGPDNLKAELLQNMKDVDVTNREQIQAMSEEEREEFLAFLIANSSRSNQELEGVLKAGAGVIDDWVSVLDSIFQTYKSGINKLLGNEGIQEAPKNAATAPKYENYNRDFPGRQ